MIRKEAWLFYRTSCDVRLCRELEETKGPKQDIKLGRSESFQSEMRGTADVSRAGVSQVDLDAPHNRESIAKKHKK